MELKNFFVQDDQGNKLPGATCYVYQRGTETLVPGLLRPNGLPLSNPFDADSNGLVQFAAANGLYDIRVVKGTRDFRLPMQLIDVSETLTAAEDAADRAENSASSNFRLFDTYADALAATLPEGQPVEVFADETRNGQVSRFLFESGNLVYKPYSYLSLERRLQDPHEPSRAGAIVAYSPPGFPAVITNIRELFDNQRQMGVPITDKLFGAGTGKTPAQNTIAIQAAHDAAAEAAGGVIQIPGGKFNYNEVRISEENIHIDGPGWLANGRLWIGDLGTAKKVLDFKISTNFTYDTLADDNIPIKLLYVVKGQIIGSKFKNCDKAIYTAPAGTWQQVARVTTALCEFDTVNYGVYLDRNVGYLNYETADMRFLFNTYLNCQKTHIYGRAVDGIMIVGEKCFFPGFNQRHATKGRNIDLQHVNWPQISTCDLFEAGLEAIKIGNFQNLKIGPNNIAWCGQRVMSSAIKLYNGDRTGASWVGDVEQHGDIYCISSVDSQNIMFPTKHGIEIDQYSGHIQVAPSQIRNPGNASFYYGTEDLNAINHYAVDSSGPDCRIDAQLSDRVSRVSGARSVLMRKFIGNEDQTSGVVSTVTVATSVINVDGVKQVNLIFPEPMLIEDFVGFNMWDMKEFTVTSFNANAVIKNSSLIHTTSGANLALASQKPVRFERIANAWYQV